MRSFTAEDDAGIYRNQVTKAERKGWGSSALPVPIHFLAVNFCDPGVSRVCFWTVVICCVSIKSGRGLRALQDAGAISNPSLSLGGVSGGVAAGIFGLSSELSATRPSDLPEESLPFYGSLPGKNIAALVFVTLGLRGQRSPTVVPFGIGERWRHSAPTSRQFAADEPDCVQAKTRSYRF
jgi:hypothetical protein